MSMIIDVILYALTGVFFSLCAIRIFGESSPRPAILGLVFGLLLCRLMLRNGKTPTGKRKDGK